MASETRDKLNTEEKTFHLHYAFHIDLLATFPASVYFLSPLFLYPVTRSYLR